MKQDRKKVLIKTLILILTFALLQKSNLLFTIFCIIIISIIEYKYKSRYIAFLLCLILGYMGWQILYDILGNLFESGLLKRYQWTILQRLGLLFYVLFFLFFQKKFPTVSKNSLRGNLKNSFRMPFFFKGFKKETVKNFLLIFISIFSLIIGISLFYYEINPHLLIFALVFSILNSILEELIWRGFALNQLSIMFSKQSVLITNALLFGIYHISLGFSLFICLIYAIGGYYMSGIAYFSKGLLSSICMHFIVNFLFVIVGIMPF